jgi:hypothetical protein
MRKTGSKKCREIVGVQCLANHPGLVWFSASIFVEKIATFTKLKNVKCILNTDY